jgi:hypothetical protein
MEPATTLAVALLLVVAFALMVYIAEVYRPKR